jgi:hypothetical protein
MNITMWTMTESQNAILSKRDMNDDDAIGEIHEKPWLYYRLYSEIHGFVRVCPVYMYIYIG